MEHHTFYRPFCINHDRDTNKITSVKGDVDVKVSKNSRYIIILILIVLLFSISRYINVYLSGTVASDSVEDVTTYYEEFYGEGTVAVYGPLELDGILYYAVETGEVQQIAEFQRLKNGRLEEQGASMGSDEMCYIKYKSSKNGNCLLIASFDNISKIVFDYNGKAFTYEMEDAIPGLYMYETESVNRNYEYVAYNKEGNVIEDYGVVW